MEGVSVEAIQEGGRWREEGGRREGGVEQGQSNLCRKTRPGGQKWGFCTRGSCGKGTEAGSAEEEGRMRRRGVEAIQQLATSSKAGRLSV